MGREILSTGSSLTAQAWEYGAVDEVAPLDTFLKRTMSLVPEITAIGP